MQVKKGQKQDTRPLAKLISMKESIPTIVFLEVLHDVLRLFPLEIFL